MKVKLTTDEAAAIMTALWLAQQTADTETARTMRMARTVIAAKFWEDEK